MTSRSRCIAFAATLISALLVPLFAQGPDRHSRCGEGVQELAKAWSALAGGRAADAERASDALLKTAPRNHDALALKVRARLAGPGVSAALDRTRAWLPSVRQRENVPLLETIATNLVESLAAGPEGPDIAVRTRALEILAVLGDRNATARLSSMVASSGTAQSDAALARLGDAAAVTRLAGRVKNGAARDVSDAIDALSDGGVKTAAGVIAGALDPARPLPTKMAAARALGRLGDPAFVPQLKLALKDPDPPVRVMAAAALAQLGDDSTADLMRTYANSPVGDLRLIAVEGRGLSQPFRSVGWSRYGGAAGSRPARPAPRRGTPTSVRGRPRGCGRGLRSGARGHQPRHAACGGTASGLPASGRPGPRSPNSSQAAPGPLALGTTRGSGGNPPRRRGHQIIEASD